MMRRKVALALLPVLAACVTTADADLARQKVGGGTDDRQRSPCACRELNLLRSPGAVDLSAFTG